MPKSIKNVEKYSNNATYVMPENAHIYRDLKTEI